jgi:hypothetical protein
LDETGAAYTISTSRKKTTAVQRTEKASRILTLDPAMCPPGFLKLRNSVRTLQLSLVVFLCLAG